jgi:hypothetical protein
MTAAGRRDLLARPPQQLPWQSQRPIAAAVADSLWHGRPPTTNPAVYIVPKYCSLCMCVWHRSLAIKFYSRRWHCLKDSMTRVCEFRIFIFSVTIDSQIVIDWMPVLQFRYNSRFSTQTDSEKRLQKNRGHFKTYLVDFLGMARSIWFSRCKSKRMLVTWWSASVLSSKHFTTTVLGTISCGGPALVPLALSHILGKLPLVPAEDYGTTPRSMNGQKDACFPSGQCDRNATVSGSKKKLHQHMGHDLAHWLCCSQMKNGMKKVFSTLKFAVLCIWDECTCNKSTVKKQTEERKTSRLIYIGVLLYVCVCMCMYKYVFW